MKANSNTAPRMSDIAVKAKTGKNWSDWFAVLDQAGGQNEPPGYRQTFK